LPTTRPEQEKLAAALLEKSFGLLPTVEIMGGDPLDRISALSSCLGAPTTLIDPMPEKISDFAWLPSGKQLAVLRMRMSSNVVLITD
jgi:hypothetical protein